MNIKTINNAKWRTAVAARTRAVEAAADAAATKVA